MTPEQFRQVEHIFQTAVGMPEAERNAYIENACARDPHLRNHVDKLLRHHDKPRVELAATFGSAVRAASDQLLPRGETPMPSRIGAYRVLRQIGEGGFGVVYLAEQESPRRTVALKVVRWSMASPDSLKRFERETYVLGRLQHSGIAQIFEAGIADAVFDTAHPPGFPPRVPFYAMEFIQGRNLLEYALAPAAGRGPLDMTERLELIARVCDALEHAHQNGIIHRDLKPDNILVIDSSATPIPSSPSGARMFGAQPKLLDFGVARALEGEANAAITHTRIGQLVGTPAYMSPEQVRGNTRHVDTRSDVYAAGVLLYQLLTGRLPYEFRVGDMLDIIRVIEESPPAPLRAPGASRTGRFNADVEAIVAKALAKDRERRYQSAAALASDIRRFLADEPIEAKRDSALYLLRKNVKRYRGALTAAATFVVLLAAFTVWAIAQARTNRQLADDAIRSSKIANEQQQRASRTAANLAAEMSLSNIDRGRAMSSAGNMGDAERLIWREYLSDPASPSAVWGLREMYARYANSASMRTQFRDIRCAAITADGHTIAVSGLSADIELWDTRTHSPLRTLRDRDTAPLDLAFSPNGKWLAVAGAEGGVTIWDWPAGRMAQYRAGHKPRTTSVCFTRDSKYLLSCGRDRLIRAWESDTGESVAAFAAPAGVPNYIRHSSAADIFASGADIGEIVLWNTRAAIALPVSSRPVDSAGAQIARMTGHTYQVTTLSFSPDGTKLASSGGLYDRTVRLWDVASHTCDAVFAPSAGAIEAAEFSPDGRTLYTGGWFAIDLWDTRELRRITTLAKGKCTGLLTCRDCTAMIATNNQDIRFWDFESSAVTSLGPHSGRSVAFDPTGRYMATSQDFGRLQLRNADSGAIIREFGPPPATQPADERRFRARAIAFDPTGEKLLGVRRDGILERWDIASGRRDIAIRGVNFISQQCVAYDPAGPNWAMARTDTTFCIADAGAETGKIPFKGNRGEALSICYSPDGSIIATTSRDPAIRLWNRKGELLARLECTATPWGLAFTPDGRKVLVGTWDFVIEMWDVATRTRERSFGGHSATVWGLQFKPDDPDIFASWSSDGSVRIWSVSTGRNLAIFDTCPGEEVIAAAFSHDGGRIAAVCGGDEVRMINLNRLSSSIKNNLETMRLRLAEPPPANPNTTQPAASHPAR